MRANEERRTTNEEQKTAGAPAPTKNAEQQLHLHHTAPASPPPPPPSPQPPPMSWKNAPTKCSPRPSRATPSVDRGLPCLSQLSTMYLRWQIGKKMAHFKYKWVIFQLEERSKKNRKKNTEQEGIRSREGRSRASEAWDPVVLLLDDRPAAGRLGPVVWASATDGRAQTSGSAATWPG